MSSKCCACQRNINHVIHCACHEKQTTHTHAHRNTSHSKNAVPAMYKMHRQNTLCAKRIQKAWSDDITAKPVVFTAVDAIPPICEHTSAHNPPTGTLRQVGKKKALPWSFRSIVLHSASTAFGDACSDSLPGCSGSGLVTTLFQANKICSKWTNKHVQSCVRSAWHQSQTQLSLGILA